MLSLLLAADQPCWLSNASIKERKEVRRVLRWLGISAARWYKRKRGIRFGIRYWRGWRSEMMDNITMNNSFLEHLKTKGQMGA